MVTEKICRTFLCVNCKQSFTNRAVVARDVWAYHPTCMIPGVFMAQYQVIFVLLGFQKWTLVWFVEFLEWDELIKCALFCNNITNHMFRFWTAQFVPTCTDRIVHGVNFSLSTWQRTTDLIDSRSARRRYGTYIISNLHNLSNKGKTCIKRISNLKVSSLLKR